MKPVVGLIGAMGSGKSRVAEVFSGHNAKVVSGDRLGHEALLQPAVKDELVGRWGARVLDRNGEIDRRSVAKIVFVDPAERRALEALSFPWIERRIKEEIAAAQTDSKVALVVLDAAIMLEAGWDKYCDRIVYVHAPRPMRLRRLIQERGWTPAELETRESAQMPLAERVSRANDVVDNSGSLEKTSRQVETLLNEWGIV